MASQDSTLPVKCLKCETDLSSPIVCDGCSTLYPVPKTADHFMLLGVERVFNLDEEKLRTSFRALSRSIHPDRFSGQPPEVIAMATRLSAEMNQAYATLKDPARRANYMLELAGGPSAADVRDVPGNLLAEIMMIREEMEEAEGDDLTEIREPLLARRSDALNQIGSSADQLATADDETQTSFRKLLNSIKYYDNLLSELAENPLDTAVNERK